VVTRSLDQRSEGVSLSTLTVCRQTIEIILWNTWLRQVSCMTDEKGETWSPFGMSKVSSRPESLVADCSMPALQPPERHGGQG